MKAAVYTEYGSPDVIRLKEMMKPVPGDNEVLIKIHATTVTAVDSIFRNGKDVFARLATGPVKPKTTVLGTEFAGEIAASGKNVIFYKPGDAVFGEANGGAHAEYICIPGSSPLALKPAQLSFEEAASVPYGALTALPFLRDNGKILPGQSVLIIGASGSVGIAAVQLAKYFGAEVTGVCGGSNAATDKAFGADAVIDYNREDFTQNGRTYDIIFDAVGKSSYFECKTSLKTNGIYLTTVINLKILAGMLSTLISNRKKAVIAFTGMRPAKEKNRDLAFIKELIEHGEYKPLIDRKYPLENIKDAHGYVDQGHKKGNVVITVGHTG